MALFSKRPSHDSLPRRRSLERSNEPTPTLRQNFFRNRTLSGIRPTVAEEPSERSRAHQLAAKRRRVAAVFGLLLLAITLIMIFLMQFTSRVAIVVSQANLGKKLDITSYTRTLDDYFSNHPVERLRFTLSTDQLTDFVVTRHPEISSIHQSTVWGIGETRFVISLRRPIAGWEIGGKQYYVDEHGVAFSTNYFDKPSVQIIDQSGVSLEQGTAVTSTRFLSLIGKIVSLAGEKEYTVTKATLPIGTTREVDVTLKSIRPYIKFSIDRGAGEQVEDMDRSLDYLKSKGRTPSYVDVRVESRAYYR